MGWAKHVACKKELRNVYRRVEKLVTRDLLGDLVYLQEYYEMGHKEVQYEDVEANNTQTNSGLLRTR